eukprot:3520190-Alexandrium_andersonii.AAC.1
MGSPLQAAAQGLKTLALRTSSSRQNSCSTWLARRWHVVVAFGVARQLPWGPAPGRICPT